MDRGISGRSLAHLAEQPNAMHALLAALLLASADPHFPTTTHQRSPYGFFPLGVWYAGGVGAFRYNLIPEDPQEAAPLYDRNFRDIAAHGINVVVAPNSTPPHHKPLLDAAEKHGLNVILELGREGGLLGETIRGKGEIDAAGIQRFLQETYRPIARHPALMRVQLLDEPWREIFPRYRRVAELLMHSTTSVVAHNQPFCCLIGADNVEGFLRAIPSDVVAFDCYPIGANTPVGDPRALSRFEEVSVKAASTASKLNCDAWAVIQCHAIPNGLRFPTAAELRCMTHLALAAGCRGIFWFYYQSEYLDKDKGIVMDGLVDMEYRERPLWREVRDLCREIKRLAPTLLVLRPTVPNPGLSADKARVFTLSGQNGTDYVYLVNTDVLRPVVATVRVANMAGEELKYVRRLPEGTSIRASSDSQGSHFRVSLMPGGGALIRLSGLASETHSQLANRPKVMPRYILRNSNR